MNQPQSDHGSPAGGARRFSARLGAVATACALAMFGFGSIVELADAAPGKGNAPAGTVLATYQVGPSGGANNDIVTGPDGALWFTREQQNANAVGRITTGGHITTYALPNADSQPAGIAAGPDGALWFAETGDGTVPTAVGRIGRITVGGKLTEYTVPNASSGKDAYPFAIVNSPDGNLWFTEAGGNGNQGGIGVITPSGVITHIYGLPSNSNTADTGAYGMVVGPNHNLWFSDVNGQHIGQINIHGQVTEFPAAPDDLLIGSIIVRADGRLWAGINSISAASAALLATTTSGAMTRHPLSATAAGGPASQVFGMAVASDGALWTAGTVTLSNPGVFRVTTAGAITFFALGGDADGLTIGPDGNVWAITDTGEILKIASGAGTGPGGSHCIVPKLKGLSLAAAKARLRAAKCKLGKVNSPKASRHHPRPKLVVGSQSPAAGSVKRGGSAVNVKLVAVRHKAHRKGH